LRFLKSLVHARFARLVVAGLACALGLVAASAMGARSDGSVEQEPASRWRLKQPTLEQVDGGPGYFGRFSNALPSRASYFPIAVWFAGVRSQADIRSDKAAGLNTYVVLTGDTNLSLLRRNGMKAFLQRSEWSSARTIGSETAGWELRDEIDMQMHPDAGYAELRRAVNELPADRRLSYNNFGKGVMFWETDAQASRYVNAVDLRSDDIYWFTDANVCTSSSEGPKFFGVTRALTDAECRRASNYGATVRRMRHLVRPRGSSPVWNFVELGHPFTEDDAPSIQPAEVRAAVWHSLIAGARGIVYFNHSFGGPCETQNILREACYTRVRAGVTSVNRQVKRLARVLNSPTVVSGWKHGRSVRAMAKWSARRFYVFAGSTENAASTGSFSIACAGSGHVIVMGENRKVPLANGSFRDTFADGNAIHIYRIDRTGKCHPRLRKNRPR
jgi:hypothetical protein